ncbi:hypothetical protein ACJMK2_018312 [Sinanodonta woodiana]|uniref:Uncharacterized protein n=1 Tax=Sinanodonta woodiana TaxID=1069815 RepID=A0ABD3UD31_SINWO
MEESENYWWRDWLFTSFFVIMILISKFEAMECSEDVDFMKVFAANTKWNGWYIYEGNRYFCIMYIQSQHYSKDNAILATFRDLKGTTMDLDGICPGSDKSEVTFNLSAVFDGGDKFSEKSGFELHGFLSKKNGGWLYSGNITRPANFGAFNLESGQTVSTPVSVSENHGWRLAVMIGVPVTLAILGVMGTVYLTYWGIKKGYIRHVPKNYSSFDNPVAYDANKEMVHM